MDRSRGHSEPPSGHGMTSGTGPYIIIEAVKVVKEIENRPSVAAFGGAGISIVHPETGFAIRYLGDIHPYAALTASVPALYPVVYLGSVIGGEPQVMAVGMRPGVIEYRIIE